VAQSRKFDLAVVFILFPSKVTGVINEIEVSIYGRENMG
jgi:hypothetical protein